MKLEKFVESSLVEIVNGVKAAKKCKDIPDLVLGSEVGIEFDIAFDRSGEIAECGDNGAARIKITAKLNTALMESGEGDEHQREQAEQE